MMTLKIRGPLQTDWVHALRITSATVLHLGMWNHGGPFQKQPSAIRNTHVALFEFPAKVITHPKEQHVTTASQSSS
jgi:hypothetical protein